MSQPAPSMAWTISILVAAQLLFTWGDLIARTHMRQGGFTAANLVSWWFALYFTIRIFATFGQLYVFASIELGKTAALFGAASIVLGNALGFLLLGEVLTVTAYIGMTLAVLAFIVLAFGGK